MSVIFAVTATANEVLADLPLADVIQPFFKQLTILFGGIAGLYLLLVLARVFYERKKVRILKDIRYDLDQLNLHYKINDSTHRKSWIRRVIRKANGDKKKKK